VRRIFHAYGVEKKGTSQIARELQRDGYCTSSGNFRWSSSHLIKLLKNEKYAGDLVQKKTVTTDYLTHEKKRNDGREAFVIIRDHHTPIVDRALWNLVQEELEKRRRTGRTGSKPSSRYPLSGKIRCGICGSGFVARRRNGKHGMTLRWMCSGAIRGTCNHGKTIRDDSVVELVKAAFQNLELPWIELIKNTAECAIAGMHADLPSPERLEFELKQIQEKKEAALDAFISGQLRQEELDAMRSKYDKQLDQLEVRKQEGTNREEASLEMKDQIWAFLQSDAIIPAVCRHLVDSVVVFPEKKLELTLGQGRFRFLFSSSN